MNEILSSSKGLFKDNPYNLIISSVLFVWLNFVYLTVGESKSSQSLNLFISNDDNARDRNNFCANIYPLHQCAAF